MVVILNITNYNLHRMFIDNGNSIDVLFYDALLKLNILLGRLERVNALISGFSGEPILVEGTIMLLVIVRSAPWRSQVHLTFTVMKTPLAYHVIFGQSELNTLRAIAFTYYL